MVVSLSAALYVLYSQTGDVDLLRERAEDDRIIAAATPPDSPEYADRAYNRGVNLLMLCQEANDQAFLAEEAAAFRAAAAGTLAGHPDRALRLRTLSDTLAHLRVRTGDDSLLRYLRLRAPSTGASRMRPGSPRKSDGGSALPGTGDRPG